MGIVLFIKFVAFNGSNDLVDNLSIIMNKIKSIYPTEVHEQEEHPLRDTYNRFSRKMDDHIKQAIVLKKHEILKQSSQFMDQIQRIKERSSKYKKKIYQQQKQFQEKVENLIKYDLKKWQDYQSFFKQHFQSLQTSIQQLRTSNKQRREQIKLKHQEIKQWMKDNTIVQIDLKKSLSHNPTTKESSVRLSYSETGNKKIKTEASLPALPSLNRYERIKTLQTQYEVEQEQGSTRRAHSYMQPIGLIKYTQRSSLPFLGQLLHWYRNIEDINNNWFLKIIYNPRHFQKLNKFIEIHSAKRKMTRFK